MVSIIFRDTCARPTAYASHACLLRYWGKRALNRWNQRNEKLLRESPLSYSGCSCPRIGKTIKELAGYMLQPFHPYPWQQYPTRYSGWSYSPTIGFIKPQPTRTNQKRVYQSRKEDAGRVGGDHLFHTFMMFGITCHECKGHSTNCVVIYSTRMLLWDRNPLTGWTSSSGLG